MLDIGAGERGGINVRLVVRVYAGGSTNLICGAEALMRLQVLPPSVQNRGPLQHTWVALYLTVEEGYLMAAEAQERSACLEQGGTSYGTKC